jgi:hypothetical protein
MGNLLWNVVMCSFQKLSIALLLSEANIFESQRTRSGKSP